MAFLLSIFYFFYFGIVAIYIIFIPKVLDMSGYSGVEIGTILAAAPLIRFLLPFVFLRGFRLDTKMMYGALAIMILASLAFKLSIEHYFFLVGSNIALGLGLGLVLPYMEVVALESIGQQNYGKVRLFGSVGFIFVALVLAHFLSSKMVALDFLVSFAFFSVVISFFILQKCKVVKETQQHSQKSINIFKDYKLWIGLTLMQVSFGSFYNFFTIYETNHGISLDTTVYLWSFGVLCEIAMLYYQGKFLKNNLLHILQLATFITVFRWLIVASFPEHIFLLFIAQSLHAFSFALFHSSAISYLHKLYSDKTLAQQFFSGITYGFGALSGALISGWIYEHFYTLLFLSSSAFAFLSFLFLVWWSKESVSTRET